MQPLIIKEYLTAIKLDEENKLLFAYDIKDNIIDEQSEGILSEVNELMYQKIASYFHIKPEDYSVYIGDRVTKEDEIEESLEIAKIIKERVLDKKEPVKMVSGAEMLEFLEKRLK
ncbi:MAG: hypothetical protein PHX65_07015 [Sulfurimonas sp.]|jgi:hypothetical protein|nr:hypothetical protein [Sulfurimonas sp.]MDY0138075.1 hypothetical protein [Candidatus Izemoplasmatales bacterium]